MKRFWHDHQASIVLGILTLIFLFISLYFGYWHWSAEAKVAHGPFWVWWLAHAGVEFLGGTFVGGLIVFNVAKLREKDSPETGDDK